ncbi:hypothetical protein AAVH_13706 [Aphelenchoides avenae]|nr:hypothetical protein AAVH_36349 [Aphelenchus avenae]KAH7718820.1 hypothetical protein AAVH_13706 [Aphelenchus avenae]
MKLALVILLAVGLMASSNDAARRRKNCFSVGTLCTIQYCEKVCNEKGLKPDVLNKGVGACSDDGYGCCCRK